MGLRGLTETVIPDGPYCYTRLGPMQSVDGGWPTMPIKTCPYWRRTENGDNAHCDYLDESDCFVLWDQIKICGVRDDFDLEEEMNGVFDNGPEQTG
jgi:hypothetical protein